MSRARKIIDSMLENLIPGKFPGMKNAQYWEVSPYKGDEVIIRCDSRVAKVNLKTGKAVLSDNGKTSHQEIERLRGPEMEVPKDMMDKIKKAA